MLYRHISMCVSCTHALLYDWQQLECVVKHVAVVFLDIQQILFNCTMKLSVIHNQIFAHCL